MSDQLSLPMEMPIPEQRPQARPAPSAMPRREIQWHPDGRPSALAGAAHRAVEEAVKAVARIPPNPHDGIDARCRRLQTLLDVRDELHVVLEAAAGAMMAAVDGENWT